MTDDKVNKRLVADLKSLLGRENISEDIYERISYGLDGIAPDLDEDKIPLVVAQPTSTQQVSKLVKYANDKKLPIYIHGAGTAFKGSARPKRPHSILLSMLGLTSIDMHEEDLYIEVGAGVNQYELEKLLLSHGYMLPMNVGSKYSATIGGAVAINTIGHMVDICLGKIIDHVMGLEVVLPNGEIIETGTRSIRRPAGIDYTRFFAGMEGLFGIITKVRLHLLPMLKKAYVLGFFPDATDIAHAFMRLYKEKLPPPLYGELLEREACRAPFRLRGLGEPKGDMALATTIGQTQEEANRQAEEIVRVFRAERAIEARVVTSPKEQEDYWESRDNISTILQRPPGEEKLVSSGGLESSVPLSHLADLIDFLRVGHNHSILHEAKLFIYGHIGTCDLHAMWATPVSWPMEKKMKCRKEALLLEKEINLKWGCASGEIGQTAARIPFLKERYGESAFSMLLDIKKRTDPNSILNPGNLEGEGMGSNMTRGPEISEDISEIPKDILDSLQICINCKMCVRMCPTYEGWFTQSTVGRLSAMNFHFKYGLGSKEELSKILFECATCRRCQEMCRMHSRNVSPADTILKARQLLVRRAQARKK